MFDFRQSVHVLSKFKDAELAKGRVAVAGDSESVEGRMHDVLEPGGVKDSGLKEEVVQKFFSGLPAVSLRVDDDSGVVEPARSAPKEVVICEWLLDVVRPNITAGVVLDSGSGRVGKVPVPFERQRSLTALYVFLDDFLNYAKVS